jgi:putative exporter of polyketide antibiotics
MSQVFRIGEIYHRNDYDSTLDFAETVAADALAIPVTHAIVQKTTGADAEALTLADGEPGQILVIHLVTDGNGDGTLTPVTATGWATIVFADVKDQAVLMFVNDSIGWIILGLSGKAGPPAHT